METIDRHREVNYQFILNTLLHNINAIHFAGINEIYACRIQTAIQDILYFITDDCDIINGLEIEFREEKLREKFSICSQRKDDDYYILLDLLSYIDYAINVFKTRTYWVTARIIKLLDDTMLDVIANSRIESDITAAYIVKSIIKKAYMTPFISMPMRVYTMFFLIGNMSRIRLMVHNMEACKNKKVKNTYTSQALINARYILCRKKLAGIISGTGLL